jgi:hypothetical protein
MKVSNCIFTTPVNYSLYANIQSPNIYVSNCTIDAASKAKAIYNPTGASYIRPVYTITNFKNSDLIDGAYYANCTLLKNYSTYRTTPPSMVFTFKNVGYGYYPTPIKIWSAYGSSGKSYQVNLWLKAGPGWSGSLDPVLKFNGAITTLGTPLTSISESWTQYSYSLSAIPSDGEISYEMWPHFDVTTPVYFDDFTITEI